MFFKKLLNGISLNLPLMLTAGMLVVCNHALAFDSLRDIPKEEQQIASSCLEGKQVIKTGNEVWVLVSKKYTEEKGAPVTCLVKDGTSKSFRFGNLELVTKNGAFRYVSPSNSNYLWMSTK